MQAGGINFADIMTMPRRLSRNPETAAGGRTRILRNSDQRRPTRHGLRAVGSICRTSRRVDRNCCGQFPKVGARKKARHFPVNYFTAYFAYWKAGLLDSAVGKTAPRVLIHAVAGGVGTAAVQIGKLLGIEMYGTSSSDEKLARVKELGLQHGINYKQRDYEDAIKDLTHGEGVDAVFEMLGGEHTAKSVRCLRDFGRVIVYGAATGQPARWMRDMLYAKGASVHGLWLTYLSAKRELMNQAWKQLSAWTAQGHLHPVIGHVFPLEKAAEAYRLLLERKNFGKVVLKLA